MRFRVISEEPLWSNRPEISHSMGYPPFLSLSNSPVSSETSEKYETSEHCSTVFFKASFNIKYTHGTPLECGNLCILCSTNIAFLWSGRMDLLDLSIQQERPGGLETEFCRKNSVSHRGVVIISQVINSKLLGSLEDSDFGDSLKLRPPLIPIPLFCVFLCALPMWSMTTCNSLL